MSDDLHHDPVMHEQMTRPRAVSDRIWTLLADLLRQRTYGLPVDREHSESLDDRIVAMVQPIRDMLAELDALRRRLAALEGAEVAARTAAFREAAKMVRESQPSALDSVEALKRGGSVWVCHQDRLADALEHRAGEGR